MSSQSEGDNKQTIWDPNSAKFDESMKGFSSVTGLGALFTLLQDAQTIQRWYGTSEPIQIAKVTQITSNIFRGTESLEHVPPVTGLERGIIGTLKNDVQAIIKRDNNADENSGFVLPFSIEDRVLRFSRSVGGEIITKIREQLNDSVILNPPTHMHRHMDHKAITRLPGVTAVHLDELVQRNPFHSHDVEQFNDLLHTVSLTERQLAIQILQGEVSLSELESQPALMLGVERIGRQAGLIAEHDGWYTYPALRHAENAHMIRIGNSAELIDESRQPVEGIWRIIRFDTSSSGEGFDPNLLIVRIDPSKWQYMYKIVSAANLTNIQPWQ